jgi:hypothetical protein
MDLPLVLISASLLPKEIQQIKRTHRHSLLWVAVWGISRRLLNDLLHMSMPSIAFLAGDPWNGRPMEAFALRGYNASSIGINPRHPLPTKPWRTANLM